MRYIWLISLLFIPCISNAEDGYWVCIGSFRDQDVAAEHRLALAHEFLDELRVVEADTPLGRFFRVLVGPYETALRGHEALEDVQRTRPDAWLVVTSVSSAYNAYNTDYIGADYEDGGYRFSDPDDSYADWEYRVPAVQDNGASIEVTSTAKIVEVAPPGYNVHRLNRGAARTDD